MAKFQFVQTTFTKGELTPRLRGRLDFQGRYDGVEEITNFLVMPHGGVTRRPGSRFVSEVKNSAHNARLIPFQFSTTQTYVIEVGDEYARFYANEGQVETGGSPVELTLPYGEDEIDELKWTQSADILYICHPDYQPRELRRTSASSFSLATFDFQDGPYLSINDTSTTLGLSGTTGSITVTASATTGINGGDGFQSTDVGRLIRWKDAADEWTWLEITAVNSTTEVDADIKGQDASATTATPDWRLGAWSDTTGWPHTTAFFDERLVFGATDSQVQTLWTSNSSDFTNFTPSDPDGTVTDSQSITVTIANDEVNAIRWLSSAARGMIIGTNGSELLMRSASVSDPVSPNSIEIRRQTNRGSDDKALPIRIDNSIIFVTRSTKTLREAVYDFDVDGFVTRDLSLLSEHLLLEGVDGITYAQDPDSTIWANTDDGKLVGLTFEREQEVAAWHQHELAGPDAEIESMATITEGDEDQTWFVVKRTIDGNTVRYVEFMENRFRDNTAIEDAFFVDCGLTYDGASTDTISGLDHLEGETVSILADGSAHPDKTVSGGSITLDREVTKAQVGLAYTSTVRTMPIEAGVEGNTTLGRTKRVYEAYIIFDNTVGAKFGPDDSNLEILTFRTPADEMDQPVPAFSGTKKVVFSARHQLEAQVTVVQDQPLPSSILGIGIYMEFN